MLLLNCAIFIILGKRFSACKKFIDWYFKFKFPSNYYHPRASGVQFLNTSWKYSIDIKTQNADIKYPPYVKHFQSCKINYPWNLIPLNYPSQLTKLLFQFNSNLFVEVGIRIVRDLSKHFNQCLFCERRLSFIRDKGIARQS